MGSFNVKEFFGSMFSPVVDDDVEEYEGEGGYYENEYDMAPVEETPYREAAPSAFVQEPAVTTPVMQQNATVIMLTPYDIRTSQIVCDHVREGLRSLTAQSRFRKIRTTAPCPSVRRSPTVRRRTIHRTA